MTDSITILRAAGFAAKCWLFTPSGGIRKTIVGIPKNWHCATKRVANIRDLSALLSDIERDSHAAVIRGQPAAGLDGFVLRNKRSFAEVPRCWAMLDIDKLPVPAACDLIEDPEGAVEFAIGKLPPEFHDAACHWQLSASAGLTSADCLSLHLWFWLDRPIGEAEWKERASAINNAAGFRLVDPATFRT